MRCSRRTACLFFRSKRSDGFETDTAELHAAGMRLKTNEARRVGHALWMRGVAAWRESETRYLGSIQTDNILWFAISISNSFHCPTGLAAICDKAWPGWL